MKILTLLVQISVNVHSHSVLIPKNRTLFCARTLKILKSSLLTKFEGKQVHTTTKSMAGLSPPPANAKRWPRLTQPAGSDSEEAGTQGTSPGKLSQAKTCRKKPPAGLEDSGHGSRTGGRGWEDANEGTRNRDANMVRERNADTASRSDEMPKPSAGERDVPYGRGGCAPPGVQAAVQKGEEEDVHADSGAASTEGEGRKRGFCRRGPVAPAIYAKQRLRATKRPAGVCAGRRDSEDTGPQCTAPAQRSQARPRKTKAQQSKDSDWVPSATSRNRKASCSPGKLGGKKGRSTEVDYEWVPPEADEDEDFESENREIATRSRTKNGQAEQRDSESAAVSEGDEDAETGSGTLATLSRRREREGKREKAGESEEKRKRAGGGGGGSARERAFPSGQVKRTAKKNVFAAAGAARDARYTSAAHAWNKRGRTAHTLSPLTRGALRSCTVCRGWRARDDLPGRRERPPPLRPLHAADAGARSPAARLAKTAKSIVLRGSTLRVLRATARALLTPTCVRSVSMRSASRSTSARRTFAPRKRRSIASQSC